MWYTYVLENIRNKKLYIGSTADLRRRFAEHNHGRGGSYTRKQGKFGIIFYEAYVEKKDALAAEKFFKTGYGREVLRGKLKNYFEKK